MGLRTHAARELLCCLGLSEPWRCPARSGSLESCLTRVMQRRLTSSRDAPKSCQSREACLVNLRCISTAAARTRSSKRDFDSRSVRNCLFHGCNFVVDDRVGELTDSSDASGAAIRSANDGGPNRLGGAITQPHDDCRESIVTKNAVAQHVTNPYRFTEPAVTA
jgi:hypothetical protein